jgi:Ni/Fe-hydrogenase subunit HybB-like protein
MALCVFVYMFLCWARRVTADMRCLDLMATFLFFALVVDATVEGLDWLHRLYSAEEGIDVLRYVAASKLFYTLLIGQACLGTLVPFLLLGTMQLARRKVAELNRRRVYFSSAALILMGVLAMRWNVVIGGQLFSKSMRGFMSYKMEFAGSEGWLLSLGLLILPFIVLTVMIKYFLALDLPTLENVVPGATLRANGPEARGQAR